MILPPFITGIFQPALVEQVAIIAWQWLVSAAIIVWAGALIAEWRLLAATRGEQRTEVSSLLLISIQRRRRQSWLWLSMILSGTVILFWLRSAQVLSQIHLAQIHLDKLPNWPTLAEFLFSTSEGWLWLTRGGLAVLAIGSLGISSLWARHHAHIGQAPDMLAGHESSLSSRYRHRRTREHAAMQQQLLAEQRGIYLNLVLAAVSLLTLELADSNVKGTHLYFTALALGWVVLLSLAVWLGGTLYLAFVFIPTIHAIESSERTQTLVELLPAIQPSIMQTSIAIGLYAIFSLEAHVSSVSTPLAIVGTLYGRIIIASIGL
jgi:hypothetical protein